MPRQRARSRSTRTQTPSVGPAAPFRLYDGNATAPRPSNNELKMKIFIHVKLASRVVSSHNFPL